jgi:hypothetical protein
LEEKTEEDISMGHQHHTWGKQMANKTLAVGVAIPALSHLRAAAREQLGAAIFYMQETQTQRAGHI